MKITTTVTSTDKLFILIVILVLVLFLTIDIIRVHYNSTPIFCISGGMYLDGGTRVYIGLGYKIIDYNKLDGYDGYKVGTWLLDYDNSL